MSLKIKELRIAAGLSQQDMADKSGISRSQFSEIETGRKTVNTLRLNAIAKALDVPVNALFASAARESYLEELDVLMSLMSDEDRAVIIQMAKSLAAR